MPMSNTAQKGLAALVLAVAGLGAVALLRGRACDGSRSDGARAPAAATPHAKNPRLVLGRAWFDSYPKKRTDEIDLWIFFGGGFGLEDKGSMWRSTIDFFDFERQGAKVDITFLQDKKKQVVAFDVVECHDKPPFDLCLKLKEPLRGKTTLYSWDDDADMDANVPWAREWRASAEVRARSARRE